jgi:hypothetical protein
MALSEITQLISNVAFPIAMCIMMGLYIKQLQDNHSKESKEFADALEGVKLVLEQLKTILERRGQ